MYKLSLRSNARPNRLLNPALVPVAGPPSPLSEPHPALYPGVVPAYVVMMPVTAEIMRTRKSSVVTYRLLELATNKKDGVE